MGIPAVIQSARVICYVNGKVVGFCTAFKFQSRNNHKSIQGVDAPEPFELAPTTTQATGSLGLLRMTASGGLEAPGIMPTFADLPRERYVSITLVDRLTDSIVFHTPNGKFTSQEWDFSAKSIGTGSASFECIDWYNELGAH